MTMFSPFSLRWVEVAPRREEERRSLGGVWLARRVVVNSSLGIWVIGILRTAAVDEAEARTARTVARENMVAFCYLSQDSGKGM